jgi:hypothetical protein
VTLISTALISIENLLRSLELFCLSGFVQLIRPDHLVHFALLANPGQRYRRPLPRFRSATQ